MAVDTQEIKGFDELARKLRAITPTLKKQALRTALAAGARAVRDEARRKTPVLQSPMKYRTPGLVRDSLSVRTSKSARQAGDVGVFVNVRPAKGAKVRTNTTRILGLRLKSRTLVRASERGAKSKRDPFYWRFLEFGTKKMRSFGMLQAGAKKLPEALRIFQSAIGKWFERAEKSGRVVP
jgi:HK97 gp10 family phage protein